MGNTESNNNYNKEQLEYRRLKQIEIMNKLKKESKNNSNYETKIKKKNHINNIEIKNTLRNNKTMQKQFINKISHEYNNLQTNNKDKEYNNVNKYLTNLDISETDNTDEQLYINQGNTPPNKVVFCREDAEKNYKDKEKKLEEEFKKEEKKAKHIFLETQKRRKEQYKSEINKFEKSNIDPYQLFKLDKNFTLNQLKSMYKKLALVTHPDRPSGSEENFN